MVKATLVLASGLAMAAAPDPGTPLSDLPAGALPFVASSVWIDAVHDTAYATDTQGARLVRVPLTTLVPDREWPLGAAPSQLAASSDGSVLWILEQGDASSVVARFNPGSGILSAEWALPIRARGLAPIGVEWLTVDGTEPMEFGQPPRNVIYFLDAKTGTTLRQLPLPPAASGYVPRGADRIVALGPNDSGRTLAVQFWVQPGGFVVRENAPQTNLPYAARGPWATDPSGTVALASNGALLGIPPDKLRVITAPGIVDRGVEPNTGEGVVFDRPERQAAFRATGTGIDQLDTHEWALVRKLPTEGVVQGVAIWRDQLVAAVRTPAGTRWVVMPNPAVGNESAQEPVAIIAVGTSPLTTGVPLTFDASGSTDPAEPTSNLRYRWDWENDGTFDTVFSQAVMAQHQYRLPGKYTARLQVMNSRGKTDSATATFSVAQGDDPGVPGVLDEPFRLPFVAMGIAFDGPRRRVYATDPASRSVVSLDLDGGRVTRRWEFPWRPGRIRTTPDMTRLYVVLAAGPHGTQSPVPGYLGEFDLTTGVLRRLLATGNDPVDVAVTDDGWIAVATIGAPNGDLVLYRPGDAVRVHSGLAISASELHLNPEQTGFCLNTPDRFYLRWDLDRNTGKVVLAAVVPGSSVGNGKFWALPGGRVLDPAGRINAGDDPRVVLSTPANAPGVLSAVVLPGGRWVAAAGTNGIHYLDLNAGSWFPYAAPPAGEAWIGPVGERHGIATIDGATTRLRLRFSPADGAETNRPPVVEWANAPTNLVVVPGSVEVMAVAGDVDGGVATAELWNGDTKVQDLDPANLRATFPITVASTNNLRFVVRDNLGATNVSATVQVIGAVPPSIRLIRGDYPAVIANTPFELEAEATDPGGSIRRVEFYQRGIPTTPESLLGVVTTPPWKITVEGIAVDSYFLAVAFNDREIMSRYDYFSIHAIGAEGDDFYRPFLVPPDGIRDLRSNVGASRQADEPPSPPSIPSPYPKSLWWRWTAPSNGLVQITTQGSSVSTYVAVYDGFPKSKPLNQVYESDQGPGFGPISFLKFGAKAGTNYYFQVESGYRGSGMIGFNLAYLPIPEAPTGFPAPPNDHSTNRTLIPSAPAVVVADTRGTVEDFLDIAFGTSYGRRAVWWEWIAPTNGYCVFDTGGSSFNTVLTVFTATPPYGRFFSNGAISDDLTFDDDSSRVFRGVRTGEHLFIRVAGPAGETGQVKLSLNFVTDDAGQPPENDAFASAIELPPNGGRVVGNTSGATLEPGEPVVESFTKPKRTVWWKWRATRRAQVLLGFGLRGASGLSRALWKGDTLGNLVPVPVVGNGPHYGTIFISEPDSTYYILTGSSTGMLFDFYLNASLPAFDDRVIRLESAGSGQFQLRYHGEIEGTGLLESSPDLRVWLPTTNRLWTPNEVLELPGAGEPPLFYRLRMDF
jgi:PKD repeat protein